MDFSI